jgi:lipopolysaccharide export system protein LptA
MILLCLAAALCALPKTLLAEKADREKPINIEADRVSVDDRNKVQVFEGRVALNQGTMSLRADKVVVTQDAEGFQKGVATAGPGGLARFRQKLDQKDEYIEGEAERIEHDTKTERSQFFNRAFVKRGLDEVRGQYILYDAATENYLVTGGQDGKPATAGAGRDSRVRVVIQPKSSDAQGKPTPASPQPGPALKSAPSIANPREENRP